MNYQIGAIKRQARRMTKIHYPEYWIKINNIIVNDFKAPIPHFIIPLLHHFTIFGQENAQNMRRQYTVVSRFDRFRTEQIRTERQFFKEGNCFQRDTKPENLACLSSFRLYNQIRDIWLAFCAVYVVRKDR